MPSSKDRILCPIRLYEGQYKKIKVKVAEDNISFQKLAEVLMSAYLKNNKEIKRLVAEYSDIRNSKRRRYELNEIEKSEILRKIEEEYSPLRNLEEAIEEIEDED